MDSQIGYLLNIFKSSDFICNINKQWSSLMDICTYIAYL